MHKLGNNKLTTFRFIQQDLPSGHKVRERGYALRRIIKAEVEKLKGTTPNQDKIYTLLKTHIFDAKGVGTTCFDMHIARATFFDYKRKAVETLANLLWDMEPVTKSYLPKPPYKRFISRIDDQDNKNIVEKALYSLMEERAWVVTIDGAGGAGKTALAFEVASQCVSNKIFNIVIWISAQRYTLSIQGKEPTKEHVKSLDDILNKIAKAVGELRIQNLSNHTKLEAIQDILSEKKFLIIIDNMETLSNFGIDRIQEFFRYYIPTPSKVLLTSRKREYVGEAFITLTGMRQKEALEFMQMECECRGVHNLNDTNLIEIYHLSAGLPLAMQFLIGRISSYGDFPTRLINQSRIDDLPKFILGDFYEQLSGKEKNILYAISIFPESATEHDIKIASNTSHPDLEDILRKLFFLFLINKSRKKTYCRYSILEPTKEFLRRKAPASFIEQAYLRLADNYIQHNQLGNSTDTLHFLNREKENVLRVMEWCNSENRWQRLISLVDLIGNGLELWGYWIERIEWGNRAVEICTQLGNWKKVAWHKVYDIGWMHLHLEEIDKAQEHCEEGLKLAEEIEDQKTVALAFRNLGVIASRKNNYDKAQKFFVKALYMFKEQNHLRWISSTEGALGNLYFNSSHYELAQEYLESALTLKEKIQDIPGITGNLSDLALLYTKKGMFSQARRCLERSLSLACEFEMLEEKAYAQVRLSLLEAELDNYEEALSIGKEAFYTNKSIGNYRETLRIAKAIISYAEKRGDYVEALHIGEITLDIAQERKVITDIEWLQNKTEKLRNIK